MQLGDEQPLEMLLAYERRPVTDCFGQKTSTSKSLDKLLLRLMNHNKAFSPNLELRELRLFLEKVTLS